MCVTLSLLHMCFILKVVDFVTSQTMFFYKSVGNMCDMVELIEIPREIAHEDVCDIGDMVELVTFPGK